MYRGLQPDQIEAMDYQRMKFWNRGHELMERAEQKAIAEVRAKNKK